MDVLANTTDSVLESAESLSREQVEDILGNPDVLHTIFLALGIAAILFSVRRFPKVLATIASVSIGLWTALLFRDWQIEGTPLGFNLPGGAWVPIIAGVLAATLAAVLVYFMWRVALAVLAAAIFMLLSLAVCHLASVKPETLFDSGVELLQTYRVVGVVVLILALIISLLLVRRFHEALLIVATVHLGTLLLITGASYFAQRIVASADTPISLLDSLARLVAAVHAGACDALEDCDCRVRCKLEIIAWVVSSWIIITGQAIWQRSQEKTSKEARQAVYECSDEP